MDQKTVAMVRRQRFTQLLDRPWNRGMRRHISIQNPASRMFHDHKDIEETKGRRHHHAEVTGDDGLGMIPNKGPPALGWSACPSAAIQGLRQVFPDGAW